MSTTDAQIKLPVTVTKNPGRRSGYTAAYGHRYYASGATQAEARDNLTAALAVALDTIATAQPRFAREDDAVAGGALWAAIPAADGGSRWWRIAADAWGGTSDSRPAAEAFDGCVGMTIVPNR
jgi:hypothetical protein